MLQGMIRRLEEIVGAAAWANVGLTGLGTAISSSEPENIYGYARYGKSTVSLRFPSDILPHF